MISGPKAVLRLSEERHLWRKEMQTEFVKGVIHGFGESMRLVT